MEENCKIIVSLSEGRIEISGSESFVTKQIGDFKEHIVTALSEIKKNSQEVNNGNSQKNGSTTTNPVKDINAYENVYTLDGDKIKIIPEMAANTNSKKVVKLAVLYAYARKLQGIETANVEEIKTECETHGILDTNFSTNVKSGDPNYYTDKDSGKARTIKINKPGEKYALEILKELNAN